jgi:TonB-dependent SusC/RagA subfamily outer membrane receptor
VSVSPRRVSFFNAANVLISAAMLISAGACYHTTSAAPQPAVVEQSGDRRYSTDKEGRGLSGLDVVPIGQSAFFIRIHSGMVGSGEPLYVIDGATMVISPSRGIDWFTPEDIAQIKVLKYPHELAVYGPRGASGVIVITTKLAAGRSGGH